MLEGICPRLSVVCEEGYLLRTMLVCRGGDLPGDATTVFCDCFLVGFEASLLVLVCRAGGLRVPFNWGVEFVTIGGS